MPPLIDHVTLTVSGFAGSKAFYEKALSPLGVKLLMEFAKAAGFGRSSTTRTTTAPSCSTRTVTTSRPSFTAAAEPVQGFTNLRTKRSLVPRFSPAAPGDVLQSRLSSGLRRKSASATSLNPA